LSNAVVIHLGGHDHVHSSGSGHRGRPAAALGRRGRSPCRPSCARQSATSSRARRTRRPRTQPARRGSGA
jgi:hypothetical protein